MARNRKIPEDAPNIPEFIEVVYGKNFRPTDVRLLNHKPLLKEPNGEAKGANMQTNGQPTKQVSEKVVIASSKQTPNIEKRLEYIGNEIANFKTNHSIEMGDLAKNMESRISKIENKFDKFASIENEIADSKLSEVQTSARLKSLVKEMQNLRMLDLRNGKKLEKLEKLEAVENEMKALNDEVKALKGVVAKGGVSEDVVSIVSIVSKAVSDLNTKVDDAALKSADLNSKILGIDFVRAAQEELKKKLEGTDSSVEKVSGELLALKTDLGGLKTNMDELKNGFGDLKNELKNDFKVEAAGLKKEMADASWELKAEMGLLGASQEEVEKRIGEKIGGISADVSANISAKVSEKASEISIEYEKVAARLLEKAMEKTGRKYSRLLKRLAKEEKCPSRARIVHLFKKKLDIQSFGKVLFVSDKGNAKFGELLFDVAKRIGKAGKAKKCEAVLVVMGNKKKADEEPEWIVKEAMKKADFVVITARHSLEKTKTLEEFKAQGRKAVAISKSLKITSKI